VKDVEAALEHPVSGPLPQVIQAFFEKVFGQRPSARTTQQEAEQIGRTQSLGRQEDSGPYKVPATSQVPCFQRLSFQRLGFGA